MGTFARQSVVLFPAATNRNCSSRSVLLRKKILACSGISGSSKLRRFLKQRELRVFVEILGIDAEPSQPVRKIFATVNEQNFAWSYKFDRFQ